MAAAAAHQGVPILVDLVPIGPVLAQEAVDGGEAWAGNDTLDGDATRLDAAHIPRLERDREFLERDVAVL